MRRTVVGALLLLVAALAACGSEDAASPSVSGPGASTTQDDSVDATWMYEAVEDAPRCEELDGQSVDEEHWKGGCKTGPADDVTLQLSTIDDCADGRKLAYNDFLWGYVGEPATYIADGDAANDSERLTATDACSP